MNVFISCISMKWVRYSGTLKLWKYVRTNILQDKLLKTLFDKYAVAIYDNEQLCTIQGAGVFGKKLFIQSCILMGCILFWPK